MVDLNPLKESKHTKADQKSSSPLKLLLPTQQCFRNDKREISLHDGFGATSGVKLSYRSTDSPSSGGKRKMQRKKAPEESTYWAFVGSCQAQVFI